MRQLLAIFQILVSIVLVVLIMVQARGTGLGRTFGGGGGTSFTRRGLENVIFKLTFVLGGLFLIISILSLLF